LGPVGFAVEADDRLPRQHVLLDAAQPALALHDDLR
jgi:hypothetical protein